MDTLHTIIDINIGNEECITAQPPVFNMNVREGKWRSLRQKNEINVADVMNMAKETESFGSTTELVLANAS